MRAIELPRTGGSRAFLLKGNPGTQLPQHTHTGSEMTAILAGSYEHEGGQFAAGDFEDADDSIVHRPIVGPEGCVCLVALNGRLRLTGVVGALLNPFVRL
jgi:putative transcriptional regulator